jgi:hypothetical protein
MRRPNRHNKSTMLETRMGPEITARLVGWLFQDGLSYAEAAARLRREHGIKASSGALSNFFQRHSQARRVPPAVVVPMLDFIIESTAPIRVRVYHCAGRLRLITRPAPARALRSRKVIQCGGGE